MFNGAQTATFAWMMSSKTRFIEGVSTPYLELQKTQNAHKTVGSALEILAAFGLEIEHTAS